MLPAEETLQRLQPAQQQHARTSDLLDKPAMLRGLTDDWAGVTLCTARSNCSAAKMAAGQIGAAFTMQCLICTMLLH